LPLAYFESQESTCELNSGQVLKVVATDSGSVRDFQAFAKQTGNELIEQQTVGNDFIHVMRRR
jgi:tRNA 2-thiouridine synthesizing protein A